jgi:hypothetical protein
MTTFIGLVASAIFIDIYMIFYKLFSSLSLKVRSKDEQIYGIQNFCLEKRNKKLQAPESKKYCLRMERHI